MLSWCFGRQKNDEEEYRQRPKTRNEVRTNPQIIRASVVVPSIEDESKEYEIDLAQLRKECLNAHNEYRQKHGVNPLSLNEKLNAYATEWAKHLAINNLLQHRKNNKYGENLYLGTNTGPRAHILAVEAWYSEIENYNFNKPGFTPSNGHFTQLVWRNSTELGVGIVTKDNRTWVVCNYNPPGNVMGNYMQCVPPLVKETVSKILDIMKPKVKKFNIKESEEPTPSNRHHWSKFELECLHVHNKYRAIHCTPPLNLDRELCDLAQDWSEQLARHGALSHRPNIEHGENIFSATNFDPTAEDCVGSWYDEIKKYNFSRPGFSMKTGHFTQVVWRDSVNLGIGKAKLNNTTFIVCNYSPAGNVTDDYEEQVPPPCNTPTTSSKPRESITTGQPQKFEQDVLDCHNDFRAMHGSPPLIINKSLNLFASDWANYLAKNNKFEARTNIRFGENIFRTTRKDIKGHEVVEFWYSRIRYYNFSTHKYSAGTGNFTQVIWKSSRELGVGIAKANRYTYVVCDYNPKGNIVNEFEVNVLPKKHERPSLRIQPTKLDDFFEKILECHNLYRRKHNCPPLQLSQELMDYCSEYASKLIENPISRRSSIYKLSSIVFKGTMPSADEIVRNWYNEITEYNFKKPGPRKSARHFTQMIWKNTKFLGVGLAKKDEVSVVVFIYEPTINPDDDFAENVPPPLDAKFIF